MNETKKMTQNDYRRILGENILNLRKKYGLSQTQFADKVGISAQAVSSYEKGLKSPTSDVIVSIANAFNVSSDHLYGIEKETGIGLDKPITDNVEAIKMLMRLYDFYGSDMHLGTHNVDVNEEFFELNSSYEAEPLEPNIEEREVFYIDSPYLSRYLSDFKKMKVLREQGTIDEELFNNWANSRIENVVKEYDEQKRKEQEALEKAMENGDLPF